MQGISPVRIFGRVCRRSDRAAREMNNEPVYPCDLQALKVKTSLKTVRYLFKFLKKNTYGRQLSPLTGSMLPFFQYCFQRHSYHFFYFNYSNVQIFLPGC